MIIFHKVKDIRNYLLVARANLQSIGFIPTMGALHLGHISLVNRAKKEVDLVVCSIYVNPTQFNDPEDFEKYPKTIEQDIYHLEKAGCNVLFLPDADEMYPNGLINERYFELGYLETVLDGSFRKGHYQGVCQVVYKLLEIISADKLYLGQKDYQQCLVLKKMTAAYFPFLQIIICPTEREENGLAMSSRNLRLTIQQRTHAAKIYQTLQTISQTIVAGNLDALKNIAVKNLTTQGFRIDYIEIANYNTLQRIADWNGKEPFVILIAAFLNEVRLIDNMLQKTA